MLRHTDLCSGIGGFALGFEWAGLSKPILFCDVEPWSRKILAKHWPDVSIAKDVKELASDPARLVPDCDILTAGYPCQPFSVAGLQRGAEDDRHIWPEIFTIIQAKRPTWIVCENVLGHINLGLDQVLSNLEAEGYSCQPFVIPACAVNAPHRRDRVWIIAHTNSQGEPDGAKHEQRMVGHTNSHGASEPGHDGNVADTNGKGLQGQLEQQTESADTFVGCGENVADTDNEGSQGRLSGRQSAEWQGEHGHARCSGAAHRQPAKDWWAVEPPVGRVAHGVPRRVDRLKGLGNAIVPQIAMQIGLTIKAVENGTNN